MVTTNLCLRRISVKVHWNFSYRLISKLSYYKFTFLLSRENKFQIHSWNTWLLFRIIKTTASSLSHYLRYSGVHCSVCFKKERSCILEKSGEICERGSYSQGRRVGSALSVEPNEVRHSDGHLMLSPYSYYYAVTTSNLHKGNDTVTSVLLARQTVVRRYSFTSIPTSLHDIPWTTPPAVYKKALWKRFRHTGFSLNSLPSISSSWVNLSRL